MENVFTLPLVNSREDIMANVDILERYLEKPYSAEGEYAKKLIGAGKCFVVICATAGFKFYPSRFVGYVGNTMQNHERMGEAKKRTGVTTKDGKKTVPRMSKFLGPCLKAGDGQWDALEVAYQNFCKKHDVVPYGNNRKFWKPISR